MKALDYQAESVVAITIDTDWAPLACVQDTLDLLRMHEAPATVFATSDLDPRALAGFDVGIHPNFCGPTQAETAIVEELEKCCRSLPRATGLRSHALVASSRHYLLLRDRFARLRYTSNCYMPGTAGIAPFATQAGVPELPIYWMDQLALEEGALNSKHLLQSLLTPGLKVFDFHPYHVSINSQSSTHFRAARSDYHDAERLRQHRRNGPGVRTILSTLLQRAQQEGICLLTCAEIAAAWTKRVKNRCLA
jgi:hypothetical protein